MTLAEEPVRRRSRRARSNKPLENIQITGRDFEILKLLARYRFMRKHFIDAFIGGSLEYMTERLGHLYRAHYIERPKQQWDYYNADQRPAIYQLDKRGYAALEALGLVEKPVAPFKHVFNEFAHNLMLSDVMANLELGARAAGATIIPISEEVTLPVSISFKWGSKSASSKNPYNPDAAFTVVLSSGKKLHFLMEVDTGSEPLERIGNLSASSYLKKMLQIEQVFQTGAYTTLGFEQLFILHVTNSEARMRHIMVDLCGPSKFNLFNLHPVLGDYRVDENQRFISAEPIPDGKLFGRWFREGHEPFDIKN